MGLRRETSEAFQRISTNVLSGIATGKIDATTAAINELSKRGLDQNGRHRTAKKTRTKTWDITEYRFAHGKAPYGSGLWMFEGNDPGERGYFTYNGRLSQAKIKAAQHMPYSTTIKILP